MTLLYGGGWRCCGVLSLAKVSQGFLAEVALQVASWFLASAYLSATGEDRS